MDSTIKILSLVEATTINAVAKSLFEVHLTAQELRHASDFPAIEEVVVTFQRTESDANEFIATARTKGLKVEVIPERRRFDLKIIPALRAVVETDQPDLIVTHSVKSHFLLLRSRLWRKFPWIAFHHGYTTTDPKMRLYNRFDRWSLPKADRVITVCKAFARELSSKTGVPIEKISVQHNSIRAQPQPDPANVKALRARFKIADDEQVVLAVGRLSREKAHADLLSAFARLSKSHPELRCKLIIVGDGPERERLQSMAESLELNDRMIFTGQVGNVQEFYAM